MTSLNIEDVTKRIKLMGVKKSHVADRVGAKPSEFSHYLSGRRGLDENKKLKLKQYLGL